ncbi:MAG: GGDEF domain-containing protein [Proteobacteria bacterium]|nr:GGDEF domain-containing protein [Pseudomonadota bacterium]
MMTKPDPWVAIPTDAIQFLQDLQDTAQTLLGAPGPKALLRRFGEAMQRMFVVDRFDCLRLSGAGAKLVLKRRAVKVPNADLLSDDLVQQLTAALGGAAQPRAVWGPGCSRMEVAGQQLYVALIDDPRARSGTLVAWSEPAQDVVAPASTQRLRDAQREQLVRVMQNEARWLRKLDRTQARLYRDDLTGLYNYRYLEIALEHELRRAERFQNNFCLLFLDLDGFKPINDQHGHLSGSGVLKQVAEVLREVLREVDIPIRYGGDEFVVLLLGASCAKGVLAAERVRRRIEETAFVVDGGRTHLTASIGVAAYPEHARDMGSLLKLADETMYSSKRNGKNRVTVVGSMDVPEKGLT